jgi:hypothetical protein
MLASCAWLSGKRISDIDSDIPSARPQAWTLPGGVIVPPAERGAREVQGLYPSSVPNDRTCCWLASRARVTSLKAKAASRLEVTIWIPDYGFFRRHPLGVDISIDGEPPKRRCCYAPGAYSLSFALPPRLRRRVGEIPLVFSTSAAFIPRAEGINSDSRRLGFVLLRIDYSAQT